jgi:hypothetical protein
LLETSLLRPSQIGIRASVIQPLIFRSFPLPAIGKDLAVNPSDALSALSIGFGWERLHHALVLRPQAQFTDPDWLTAYNGRSFATRVGREPRTVLYE